MSEVSAPELRAALDAANALIGEAADEAARLQERIDVLGSTIREWRELGRRIVGLVERSGEVTVSAIASPEWESLRKRYVELGGEI